jgi:glutathione S-transferase
MEKRMKIYWIKAQAPRKVVALARHLGVEAEFEHVDALAGGLKTPAYAALNPNRKAPTMVDGEFVLWESPAIMIYLCNKVGSDMWPATDLAEQVEVMRWISWNDTHWMRAVGNFYFEYIIKPRFHIGEPDGEALKEDVAGLHALAKILDDHLAGRDYVACGRLTIADFQLAAMATDWREAHMPLGGYGNIVRWLDGLMTIPAWANPWPESKPESRQAA